MREILFRGQIKDKNGNWAYGNLHIVAYDSVKSQYEIWQLGSNTQHCFVVSEKTVGQFIGLLDKNNNKIFEGDIVKCENFLGEVVYSGSGFGIKDIPQRVEKSSWYILNHCEVIGNIHDNPELLEKVQ